MATFLWKRYLRLKDVLLCRETTSDTAGRKQRRIESLTDSSALFQQLQKKEDWFPAQRRQMFLKFRFAAKLEQTMSYDALSQPNLHRLFAKTPPRPVEIKRFIVQYGALGFPQDEQLVQEYAALGLQPLETLWEWANEISGMAELVKLTELVREKKFSELRALVVVAPKPKESLFLLNAETYWSAAKRKWQIQPGKKLDGLLLPDDNNEVPEPAVSQFVRSHILEAVNAAVGLCAPRFSLDSKWGIELIPPHLYGALFLQLGYELIGRYLPARCPHCGELFAKSRIDQRYCSERCRWAHYHRGRNRKRRARALAQKGLTCEQIADRLQVEADQVRVWLAEAKEEDKDA